MTDWKKLAYQSREELLDTLSLELENVAKAKQEIFELKKRNLVVIAATNTELELSLNRINVDPTSVTPILTEGYWSETILLGLRLKNEHVLLVPGWARGKNAEAVKYRLEVCGVNWVNCLYAPSPETDRAEGISNWGRLESEIVDDTLKTVKGLLDRTLEKTAE